MELSSLGSSSNLSKNKVLKINKTFYNSNIKTILIPNMRLRLMQSNNFKIRKRLMEAILPSIAQEAVTFHSMSLFVFLRRSNGMYFL